MNKKISSKGWVGKKIESFQNKTFDPVDLQCIDMKKYPYLLESSSRGNDKNRFSILFYKPEFLLEKVDGEFLKKFDKLWNENKVDQDQLFWDDKKLPFVEVGLYI